MRRREPSINFLDAVSGGVIGLDDPAVLAVAAGLDRILVSHGLRTMPAHFAYFTTTHSSPGGILVVQNTEIGVAIEDLLLIWATTEAHEWHNRLGYVPI